MQCDMCGKEARLVPVIIEGTELMVCDSCSGHGTVLKRPTLRSREKPEARSPVMLLIVDDYAQRIKQARERIGLKQIELATRISERESVIQNVESGKHEPSISLARKFEKGLKIVLVEQEEPAKFKSSDEPTPGLTIADLLK